jgi:hypothetical protein
MREEVPIMDAATHDAGPGPITRRYLRVLRTFNSGQRTRTIPIVPNERGRTIMDGTVLTSAYARRVRAARNRNL